MNRRFMVTVGALVALVAVAGCGAGSVTASATPSAARSAAAASMRGAGSVDVQDVSFVSADQGWALGRGELVSTTDGGDRWTRKA